MWALVWQKKTVTLKSKLPQESQAFPARALAATTQAEGRLDECGLGFRVAPPENPNPKPQPGLGLRDGEVLFYNASKGPEDQYAVN